MNAKRILVAGLLAVGLGAGTAAWAQHDHGQMPMSGQPAMEMQKEQGKSMTIQGELVDMACYVGHEGKGPKHKACALSCIKDGAPMGVLSSDQKLVLLVEDHEAKAPYTALKDKAGDQVKVTGTYFERGGLPALVVASFEGVK